MGGTFEIVHIRTPAVQHKKTNKKNIFFVYISMGVHRKEKLIL